MTETIKRNERHGAEAKATTAERARLINFVTDIVDEKKNGFVCVMVETANDKGTIVDGMVLGNKMDKLKILHTILKAMQIDPQTLLLAAMIGGSEEDGKKKKKRK